MNSQSPTLQERALESYKKYGAERLERLQDPQITVQFLERELGIAAPALYRDAQGIVMAESEGLYFHLVDDSLHVLLEKSGQRPNWNPFEGLVGLGRLIMMRDEGQFSFAVPPELHPL